MEIEKRRKGLTSFDLKIMALVLMLFDHIHYIFDFTGVIPIWFSWLGRLSGGLFLFTMVEGYCHTSNKKKYFLKIYLMGLVMSLVKYYISFSPDLIRSDNFFPQNGILQTFSLLIIMFVGIDLIKEKKWIKGILTIASTVVISYIFFRFISTSTLPIEIKNIIYVIFTSLVPYKFYRGDESRKSSGSTGLGLYISNKLAKIHGGEVVLKNNDKAGARVIIIVKPIKF